MTDGDGDEGLLELLVSGDAFQWPQVEHCSHVRSAVRISSLAFNPDSRFLAASSDTETVHVFKLDEPVEPYARTI